MQNAKARILIVDGHPILREGLVIRINQEADLAVCGATGDAGEAMRLIPEPNPDLVLTDLRLAGKSGLDLIKEARRAFPGLRILVLSVQSEQLWAPRVLRAGAEGYALKSLSTTKVLEAIRCVLDGKLWVSDWTTRILLRQITVRGAEGGGSTEESGGDGSDDGPPIRRLTDRELEVFEMIGQRLTVRQIAERLGRSTRTIELHRDHIRRKLGVPSSTELAYYATLHAAGEA